MEIQTHLAAQYLATANKSFVSAKSDDSHTNLGFETDNLMLRTHPLSKDGTTLGFDYSNFNLVWDGPSGKAVFSLEGKQHKEVILWLKQLAKKNLGKTYAYDLHYELPYSVSNDFLFEGKNEKELKRLSNLRVLAQQSLEQLVKKHHLETDIRVWPHHFDTGGYAALPNTPFHVGFGLAIPDTLCDSHYFYLSAYLNNAMVSTNDLNPLHQGQWLNGGFKGAILSAVDTNRENVISFYDEALAHYVAKS